MKRIFILIALVCALAGTAQAQTPGYFQEGFHDTRAYRLYDEAGNLAITLLSGNITLASSDDLALTASGDDVIITAADDVVLQGGGSGDVITLAGGGTSVDLTVADNLLTVASGTSLTMTSGTFTITAGDAVLTAGDLTITAGAINVPAASNLGFIDENSANQACDTTCTAGCVAGFDQGSSVFVDCADATADSCLCAGAVS